MGEGNNIAVFSAATGASLFTYAGAGPFWGPPSIVNGTLYEGDMAGNLYALTVNQTPARQAGLRPGPLQRRRRGGHHPGGEGGGRGRQRQHRATDNATQVSLAIGTNPAGGTLSGGSAVTVASGIATFSGLSINTAGTGYTLTASSTPTYTSATSAAFNINPQATNFTISVNLASSATITAGGSASLSETGLPPAARGTVSFSTKLESACAPSA